MPQAILFDLDGTLAHTDPIHMQAWQEELAGHDLHIDAAFYKEKISGRLNPHIVADLLPDLGDAESGALIDRKEARFRDLAHALEPLAGLTAVLEWARQAGVPVALVTNAPRDNASFMLAALGLEDAFPTIVLGQDAPPGKPDPAPYRKALDALGVEPARTVAFEDSVAGVRSAHGAGIPVVGVTTTHGRDHLLEAGAFMTAADFRDPEVWRRLKGPVQESS